MGLHKSNKTCEYTLYSVYVDENVQYSCTVLWVDQWPVSVDSTKCKKRGTQKLRKLYDFDRMLGGF